MPRRRHIFSAAVDAAKNIFGSGISMLGEKVAGAIPIAAPFIYRGIHNFLELMAANPTDRSPNTFNPTMGYIPTPHVDRRIPIGARGSLVTPSPTGPYGWIYPTGVNPYSAYSHSNAFANRGMVSHSVARGLAEDEMEAAYLANLSDAADKKRMQQPPKRGYRLHGTKRFGNLEPTPLVEAPAVVYPLSKSERGQIGNSIKAHIKKNPGSVVAMAADERKKKSGARRQKRLEKEPYKREVKVIV